MNMCVSVVVGVFLCVWGVCVCVCLSLCMSFYVCVQYAQFMVIVHTFTNTSFIYLPFYFSFIGIFLDFIWLSFVSVPG